MIKVQEENMDNTRLVALEALLQIDFEEGYSNIVIDNFLNRSDFTYKDKSFISAIIYGVLERRIELDYIISMNSHVKLKKISRDNLEILRMGVYQIKYMDKIPNFAAINESVKLVKIRKNFKSVSFVNAVLRSVDRNLEKIKYPPRDDFFAYCSLKYSCPKWLVKHFVSSYGEAETVNILRSFLGKPPIVVRVNTLKNSDDELIGVLRSEGINAKKTFIKGALNLDLKKSMIQIRAFREGRFHVEDLASQICCEILDPREGQTVVDVCSAPGGKAFNIAQRMNNTGKILAFDLYESKIDLINEGAKRLGISIIDASVRDAGLSEGTSRIADRVICDVPCSGLGIIRRKPEIKYKNEEILDSLTDLQYLILCNSEKFTKENGILIYSTCTLNPKENGCIADKFLKCHGNYKPYEFDLPEGVERNLDEPLNQLTLFTHKNGTDGFFIAAFRKCGA